ncbi:MAG: hypothetical protein ABSE82_09765, partial [Nitrososphaerales archaeon]
HCAIIMRGEEVITNTSRVLTLAAVIIAVALVGTISVVTFQNYDRAQTTVTNTTLISSTTTTSRTITTTITTLTVAKTHDVVVVAEVGQ